MLCRVLAVLLGVGLWVPLLPAQAPEPPKAAPKPKVKTLLKVKVPQEDAELRIFDQTMKTTGTVREFDVPELEEGTPWEYELTVIWEPNNYTKITRRKIIKFKAGEAVEVDLTVNEGNDKAVIRYVPTPPDIVQKMLELAKIGPADTVFDLGCGDGRLVIAAVKAGAKKGIGVDLDPQRVKESKENVEKAQVAEKVEIRQGDLLELNDLGTANVVLLYLSDEMGAILKPKLQKDLKPGTRVVSHRFTLGDWQPDQTIKVKGEDGEEYTLHLWVVK